MPDGTEMVVVPDVSVSAPTRATDPGPPVTTTERPLIALLALSFNVTWIVPLVYGFITRVTSVDSAVG